MIVQTDSTFLRPNAAYAMKQQSDAVPPIDSTCRDNGRYYDKISAGEDAPYENAADDYRAPITKDCWVTAKNIPIKYPWTDSVASDSITIERAPKWLPVVIPELGGLPWRFSVMVGIALKQDVGRKIETSQEKEVQHE